VIELKAPDVTIASTTAETMCAIKAAYAFFSAISKLPHDDSGNCQKYQVLIDFVRLLQNTKIKIPKIAKRVKKSLLEVGVGFKVARKMPVMASHQMHFPLNPAHIRKIALNFLSFMN
jgi:hypothetical protein